jgi:hypothetical protein
VHNSVDCIGNSTYDETKAETTNQSRRDSLYDSANLKRYAAQDLAIAGTGCTGAAVWLYFRPSQQPGRAAKRARRKPEK